MNKKKLLLTTFGVLTLLSPTVFAKETNKSTLEIKEVVNQAKSLFTDELHEDIKNIESLLKDHEVLTKEIDFSQLKKSQLEKESTGVESQLNEKLKIVEEKTQQITKLTSRIEELQSQIEEKRAKTEAAQKAEEEKKRQAQQTQNSLTPRNVDSTAEYTLQQFMFAGVVNWNGYKYTYYSERVLPGGGLNIPGRHLNENGYVVDGDGYIVLANSAPLGTIFPTPFGGPGKVYDRGTVGNHLDVYVK